MELDRVSGYNWVSHGITDQPGVQEQGQSSPLQGHEGKRHQPGLVELNRLSPGVWLYKLGVLRRHPWASMRVAQLRTLVEVGHSPVGANHSLVEVDHNPVEVDHSPVLGAVDHNPVEQVEDSKPEGQKVGLEAQSPSPAASRRKTPSYQNCSVAFFYS